MRRARRVPAGPDHQQSFPPEVVDQVVDHGEGVRVRVVQVLDDQQAAVRPAHGGEQPQHRLGEHHQRVVRGRVFAAPLRDQRRQRRPVRRQLRTGRRPVPPQHRQQRLGQRPELRLGVRGPSPQHGEAGLLGEPGGLRGEAGLADAGLPEHEHRSAASPGRRADRGPYRRQFVHAADHGRAGEPDQARAGRLRGSVYKRQLQLAQLPAGQDAQLLREGVAQPAVALQRAGLPPAAVEGEDQLALQPLVQRVLQREPFQLGQDVGVLAQLQPRVHQQVGAAQEEGAEALGGLVEPGDAGDAAERFAAPQPARPAGEPGPVGGAVRTGRLIDQVTGELGVDRPGRQDQQVARWPGDDRLPTAEQRPQVRDVPLQRVGAHRPGRVAPDDVGELVGGDDLTVVEGEHRQQRLTA